MKACFCTGACRKTGSCGETQPQAALHNDPKNSLQIIAQIREFNRTGPAHGWVEPLIVQCGRCGEHYAGHHDCDNGNQTAKQIRELQAEIRLLQDVIRMLTK